MATLKELQTKRAELDKEIKEREKELAQLSFSNLSQDLDGKVDNGMSLMKVIDIAASKGLALMTTKDHGEQVFAKKYSSEEGEKFTDAARRIIEGMGGK